MFCFIHKWFISRKADLYKALPLVTARHIHTCSSCRKFADLCDILPERLSSDSDKLAHPLRENLEERVQRQLSRKQALDSGRKPRWKFQPVWGAIIVLSLIITGYLIFTWNSDNSVDQPKPSLTFSLDSSSISSLIAKAQSPLEMEYDELKRTFHKTQYLLTSFLDIQLTGKK
jgi:hypothetical protein